MPKVTDQDQVDAKVMDQEDDGIKETFQERLRRLFKPTDTVQVINVCADPVEWVYLEDEKEQYTIEDDSNIKITTRERPDLWKIEPGDIDVLDGGCAYRCLEVMFKQKCVEDKGTNPHPLDERDIINYQFDDFESQARFVKKAYIGKITPAMMKEAALREIANNEQVPKSSKTDSLKRSGTTRTSNRSKEPVSQSFK